MYDLLLREQAEYEKGGSISVSSFIVSNTFYISIVFEFEKLSCAAIDEQYYLTMFSIWKPLIP